MPAAAMRRLAPAQGPSGPRGLKLAVWGPEAARVASGPPGVPRRVPLPVQPVRPGSPGRPASRAAGPPGRGRRWEARRARSGRGLGGRRRQRRRRRGNRRRSGRRGSAGRRLGRRRPHGLNPRCHRCHRCRSGWGRARGGKRHRRRAADRRGRGALPGVALAAHPENGAADAAPRPDPGVGDLVRVDAEDAGAIGTGDVHRSILTAVLWIPRPSALRRWFPAGGPPRTPSPAGSWRSSSFRWQARSPAPDAQTGGGGW